MPEENYYGIQTLRASENFALNYSPVHFEIIKAPAFSSADLNLSGRWGSEDCRY